MLMDKMHKKENKSVFFRFNLTISHSHTFENLKKWRFELGTQTYPALRMPSGIKAWEIFTQLFFVKVFFVISEIKFSIECKKNLSSSMCTGWGSLCKLFYCHCNILIRKCLCEMLVLHLNSNTSKLLCNFIF